MRDERDTWLAGLARAGHGRALDELLERHWSLMHHIVGCGLVEHSDVDRALTTLAARLRDTAPAGGEQVRAWFAAEARRQVRSSRRPGRAGGDGPDFAATAVAGLGLTGQARHLVEALRWLAPHDRDTFALWWLAESGELTAAEVAAASGGSPSDSDARVRRMAPRLDAARRLVAALAADPVCGDLALLAGGTTRRPEPHRRDRLATHVAECSRCATDLEPVEPLLGSLGLVPAPAIPASRASALPRSSAPASRLHSSTRRRNAPAFDRPRDVAAIPDPAAVRGAAGARRFTGRRNSTASWGDLAMGGADPVAAGSADSADSQAPGPDSLAAGSRAARSGAAAASNGSGAGHRGPVPGLRAMTSRGGSAIAGARARLARLAVLADAAGTGGGASSMRSLASRIADTTSALTYRGRRFRSAGLPRRAILVALAAAMLVVVAVVANGATRSAAPVPDQGPATTTAVPEPPPAAVTTIPGTPPASGFTPPGRAVAPERMPAPGLTSAAAATPSARPPVTTSYEAEAARFIGSTETMTMPGSSGGRIVHKLGTGSSNPYGYVERGAIEFTVNAPTARTYVVTVYYVDAAQRTAYVRLNNGQSQAWTFRAGRWDTVSSATFQLDLRVGANSVYFHNPADWTPRLDRITVTG